MKASWVSSHESCLVGSVILAMRYASRAAALPAKKEWAPGYAMFSYFLMISAVCSWGISRFLPGKNSPFSSRAPFLRTRSPVRIVSVPAPIPLTRIGWSESCYANFSFTIKIAEAASLIWQQSRMFSGEHEGRWMSFMMVWAFKKPLVFLVANGFF